jgi:uncharacterized membrane protein YbhN (UPF0104 family)
VWQNEAQRARPKSRSDRCRARTSRCEVASPHAKFTTKAASLPIQHFIRVPEAYRRWLVSGFCLALTAATLFFVFQGIDKHVFERLLATQNQGLLAAAFCLILLQISFGAERWRAILSSLTRGRSPAMLSVQAVFYASSFFNCLPLGTIGGDVARIWLARKFALSISQLVLSVLLDRMLVVGALIVLAVVALPTIAHPLASTAWFGGAAILMSGAIGFLLLEPIERRLGRWRDQRLIYVVLHTTEQLRHLTQRGGMLGLLYALLSATSAALALYCIARSLDIGVGPIAMIAVTSMMTLVVALPISVAGWGVREVSLVTLLGFLGVEREAALLLSVEFGLLSTLVNLSGGVMWLALRERRNVALPMK